MVGLSATLLRRAASAAFATTSSTSPSTSTAADFAGTAWCAWRGLSSCSSSDATECPEVLSDQRAVVRLHGPDTFSFLQGLVTNDVDVLKRRAEAGESASMYAAILNSKGRILHDLFLYTTPELEEDGGLLLDVCAGGKDAIVRLFKKYKLRARVSVEEASDDFAVAVSATQLPLEGSAAAACSVADPRTALLGHRSLVPAGWTAPSTDAAPAGGGGGGGRAFAAKRLALGIAEGDAELMSGEAIPVEFNLVGLNAVSFTKGCYVGQELTARTHFRGVVRKRLLPVTLLGVGAEDEAFFSRPDAGGDGEGAGGDTIRDAEGKKVGRLIHSRGQQGLALLQLKHLVARGDKPLAVAGSGVRVVLPSALPLWWPKEWYEEAQ